MASVSIVYSDKKFWERHWLPEFTQRLFEFDWTLFRHGKTPRRVVILSGASATFYDQSITTYGLQYIWFRITFSAVFNLIRPLCIICSDRSRHSSKIVLWQIVGARLLFFTLCNHQTFFDKKWIPSRMKTQNSHSYISLLHSI